MPISRWSQCLPRIRRSKARAQPDWQTPEEYQEGLAVNLVFESWEAWRKSEGEKSNTWNFSWESAPSHGGCYVRAGEALFWCSQEEAFPLNEAALAWYSTRKNPPEDISEEQGVKLLETSGSLGGRSVIACESRVVIFNPFRFAWQVWRADVREATRLWTRVREQYSATKSLRCEGTATTRYTTTTLPNFVATESFSMVMDPEGQFVLESENIHSPDGVARPLRITSVDGKFEYVERDEPAIVLPDLEAAVYRAAFHGFGGSTLTPLLLLGACHRHLIHNWVPPRLRYREEIILSGRPYALLTQMDEPASERTSIWIDLESLRIHRVEVSGTLDGGHYEAVLQLGYPLPE